MDTFNIFSVFFGSGYLWKSQGESFSKRMTILIKNLACPLDQGSVVFFYSICHVIMVKSFKDLTVGETLFAFRTEKTFLYCTLLLLICIAAAEGTVYFIRQTALNSEPSKCGFDEEMLSLIPTIKNEQ